MKAILLAGGNSTRMGSDKSLLIIETLSLIELIALQLLEIFEQLIIITNERLYPKISIVFNKYINVQVYTDLITDKGPISGLYTALKVIDDDAFFLTSCDVVYINKKDIELMQNFIQDYDVVAPLINKRYEPMFAFYSRSSLHIVHENINKDRLSMQKLLVELNTKAITFNMNEFEQKQFRSLNTEDEFQTMLPILREIEQKFTNQEE